MPESRRRIQLDSSRAANGSTIDLPYSAASLNYCQGLFHGQITHILQLAHPSSWKKKAIHISQGPKSQHVGSFCKAAVNAVVIRFERVLLSIC